MGACSAAGTGRWRTDGTSRPLSAHAVGRALYCFDYAVTASTMCNVLASLLTRFSRSWTGLEPGSNVERWWAPPNSCAPETIQAGRRSLRKRCTSNCGATRCFLSSPRTSSDHAPIRMQINSWCHIKGFAPRWLAPVMVLVLCSMPNILCSLLSECSQN